jgi:phosphopantothenoylcysteine decarboxylase/phosphopantothenate--cysteine ligase
MRVLLAVTGGVAAFKAPSVVRRLRESGHEVRCAVTAHATSFVAPLTLEVLSGQPVYDESYLAANGSGEELHVTAAEWAQVLCIAPATANSVAKLALGLADDFVGTLALAFDGRLLVAPAMHPLMWAKPSVQENVRRLRERGAEMLGPVQGALASGEVGWGRMVEPQDIVAAIDALAGPGALAGRKVVVSAGPTYEAIDPVRFLGNRSSGKMGFALASAAAARDARVVVVAGPVALETPDGAQRIDVESALEMQEAVHREARDADLVIMAAAVSDFRPSEAAGQKIKKGGGLGGIDLVETPDILAGLAAVAPTALRVGFAAETERLEEHARAKMEHKNVHFLVANDVSRSDIGFGHDDNEVTLLGRDGSNRSFDRASKREIAEALIEHFASLLDDETRSEAR